MNIAINPHLVGELCGKPAQEIHEYSLDILQQHGIVVPSDTVLTMLQSEAVAVDFCHHLCRFSRNVVEKSLRMAPSRFTLHGRDQEHDLRLGEGETYITNDGTGNSVLEHNGLLRPSTLHDLRNATILSEALTSISVSGPMVAASESGPSGNLVEIAECLKLSCKHIQHEVATPQEAEGLLSLIDIFGRSPNPRLHSQLSAVYCPISPLRHIAPVLDAYVLLARNSIPIMIMPMPMMGATAPSNVWATAVQANAEFLGTLCILQTIAPGLPVIYGVGAGVMAYKDARFSCGGPAALLLGDLLVTVARHYGMPCCAPGFVTDAPNPGLRTQTEKTMTGFWAIVSGVDLVYGIGMVDSSKTLSLEQLLIDDEMANGLLWFSRKRETAGTHAFVPDIPPTTDKGEILPYISSKADLERFRQDSYIGQGILGETFSDSAAEMARAHARSKRILADYRLHPASEDARREADKVLRAFS